VNFLKSSIGGVGVGAFYIQGFAAILNCEVMKVPFKYLGLSIGRCHKRGAFWDGVMARIKSRLGRWKGRNLSMAKRICLIKSVISTIPLFYMTMFIILVIVIKKMVSIQRKFLWGWGSEGRKITWVSWENVCESRESGGLGVVNIKDFNSALLGKWVWRLGSNEVGLWKEVVESKYGGWRNLKEDRCIYNASIWWKGLKSLWKLEKWGNNFGDCSKWEVGNGKSIKFWEDRWVGDESLMFKFPRFFSLSVEKNASLNRCGSWTNGVREWSLVWRISLFDWEKVQVRQLLEVVHVSCPVMEKVDRWVWKVDKLQQF